MTNLVSYKAPKGLNSFLDYIQSERLKSIQFNEGNVIE